MRALLLALVLTPCVWGQERVRVETLVARTDCFVQEQVNITLRISYDETFFAEHAVQMFHQHFDLPVKVEAPWLEGLKGVDPGGSDSVGVSFALNDDAAVGRRGAASSLSLRTWVEVDYERTLVPTQPGELRLAAPSLRYVYGNEFEDDFIHGRIATIQHAVTVRGKPLVLHVRPLPDAGRPAGFTGAVGHFSVEAHVGRTELDLNEPFRLTLRIRGVGNFESFRAPRLDSWKGLHLLGRVDDRGTQSRTIGYDFVATTADVTTVPAVAFSYFDPRAPAGYRTVKTPPIALRIRGAADSPEQSQPPAAPEPESRVHLGWIAAALLLAAGVILLRRRKVQQAAEDVVDATAEFRAAAVRDPADAFAGYLATRLGCSVATVIGPDLGARLESAGVNPDAAARAGAMVERLVGARYGGAAIDEVSRSDALALVEELERTLA